MIVLGISGLENSVPFKKSHWPGLEEREYRRSQGHDSAAALVIDGRLTAAVAEERINRKKHSGDFPIGAISYCLAEAGLPPSAIDAIVHSFDYSPFREVYQLDSVSAERYRDVFAKEALQDLVRKHIPGCPLERVSQINHHLAHAASAYFTSGWYECLVSVVDAMGEAAGVTVYHAHDGRLNRIREFS